jgi:hypothetical protein
MEVALLSRALDPTPAGGLHPRRSPRSARTVYEELTVEGELALPRVIVVVCSVRLFNKEDLEVPKPGPDVFW